MTPEIELDGTTHAEGCHTWGAKHYACALERIKRLEAGGGELETVAWMHTLPKTGAGFGGGLRHQLLYTESDANEELRIYGGKVTALTPLAHRDAIREALELVARDAIACIQSAFYAGRDKNDSGTLLKANINELSVRLDAALLSSPGTV